VFQSDWQFLFSLSPSRDDKEILKWTTYAYHKQSLELAKTLKSKYRDAKAIWELRREVNPTQVLSLRITEGYLAPENPRFGNRLLIHALVKFDTEQVRYTGHTFVYAILMTLEDPRTLQPLWNPPPYRG